jgi:hypothetical protein
MPHNGRSDMFPTTLSVSFGSAALMFVIVASPAPAAAGKNP